MAIAGPGYLLKEDGGRFLTDGIFALRLDGDYAEFVSTVPAITKEDGDFLLNDDDNTRLLLDGISAAVSGTAGTINDSAVFPPDISRGATSTYGFRGEHMEDLDDEMFMFRWQRPQATYDIAPAVMSFDDPDDKSQLLTALRNVLTFYRARRGPLEGFRLLDPIDHSTHHEHHLPPVASDWRDRVTFGAGDGSSTGFFLIKRYRWGSVERIRPITRPILAGLKIWINGVLQSIGANYSIDPAGGTVNFVTPPAKGAQLEWAGQFHVPVRFGVTLDAAMMVNMIDGEHVTVPPLPLVEINETVEFSDHKWMGGVDVRTITQNEFASAALGFVHFIRPDVSGLTLFLPETTHVIDGGPAMYVINTSATNSVKLADGTTGTTVVASLAPGNLVALHIRADKSWLAIS